MHDVLFQPVIILALTVGCIFALAYLKLQRSEYFLFPMTVFEALFQLDFSSDVTCMHGEIRSML